MSKRIGLPVTLKMRHDAHYVETLTSFSGASIGRMIPIDKIRPNPDQPRKNIGDVRELADSIREKGVLEPLLVRYMPREDTYYIISGERRYHASQAAGLHELPCIEKIADDAETLELALIENLQRKDLTPFEEADGLQRLADQFDYTHDDIAKKIGRARSSVTETMSLRVIPDDVRRACVEKGIASKSLLLQVARQPSEKKMHEMVQRIAQGGLTRDEARRARKEETESAPRPQPFIFDLPGRGRLVPPRAAISQEPRQRQKSSPPRCAPCCAASSPGRSRPQRPEVRTADAPYPGCRLLSFATRRIGPGIRCSTQFRGGTWSRTNPSGGHLGLWNLLGWQSRPAPFELHDHRMDYRWVRLGFLRSCGQSFDGQPREIPPSRDRRVVRPQLRDLCRGHWFAVCKFRSQSIHDSGPEPRQ